MTAAHLAGVVQALGTIGAAIDQLEREGAADRLLADEARRLLGGLLVTLDRMTDGAGRSPRLPADVVDLATRRRQRGGGR